MNEFKKTLKSISEKYKKEYASVCEPVDGLVSRQNNALKFDQINKKLITEIVDKTGIFVKQNPEFDKSKVIEIGQSFIRDFSISITDPFA